MFADIKEALDYIENRRQKHTLDYFKSVLDHENIDYLLPCIHVTGTNGKGGTINFISHILQKANYKVGTFTSPYIVCHQDRFMINGKMMSNELLLGYINKNLDIIEKYDLAMFEIDFIIMLQYFKDQQVDIALIEVGIGGRNDKTNMIMPMASIITNVGHDHFSQIGPTLKDVAYEKAGIIKDGVPCFIGDLSEDLVEVFKKEANLKHSKLSVVKVNNPYGDIAFELEMEGSYHLKNACMAIEVVKTVFPHLTKENIKSGLKMARWPGRFEKFEYHNATVYLDGAHNLDAIDVLLESVSKMNFVEKPIFVYAALKDKDFQLMASKIREQYNLHVCKFSDGRSLSEQEISLLCGQVVYDSIEDALNCMKQEDKVFVVCGSLHFISQFRNKIVQNTQVV